jgi:hypothetical protein
VRGFFNATQRRKLAFESWGALKSQKQTKFAFERLWVNPMARADVQAKRERQSRKVFILKSQVYIFINIDIEKLLIK